MAENVEKVLYRDITMFEVEDKTFYYRISCEHYLDEAQDWAEYDDILNVVDTSFKYSVDGIGLGVGHCDCVYTHDIKNMYEQLVELKNGNLEKMSVKFRPVEYTCEYYFRTIILPKFNGHYNAYFEVIDDTDVVRLWKSFTEDELDEQIRIWENCMKEFPVR